jgi:hypothetical protein
MKKIDLKLLIKNNNLYYILLELNNLATQLKVLLFQVCFLIFNFLLYMNDNLEYYTLIYLLFFNFIIFYFSISSYLKVGQYYRSNKEEQQDIRIFFKEFIFNRFYKKSEVKIMTVINKVLLTEKITLYRETLLNSNNKFFHTKIFDSLEYFHQR